MPSETDDRLMVSDPRAIRTMTTPLRKVVIDEIYRSQRPRTATELARMTGITASAMSYHLRELENVGVIRRADASESDGRERPWMALARNYSIVASDDSQVVERAVLLDSWLTPMRDRMQQVLENRSHVAEHERRERYMVLAVGDLLLTWDELAEAQAAIDAVWRRFEDLSAHRDLTDGYQHARYMWSCLPESLGADD